MESVMTVLQIVGIVAVGLLVRLALVLLAVAVLMIPVSIGLGVMFGYQALRRRSFGIGLPAPSAPAPRTYYGPAHTWARRVAPARLEIGVDQVAQRLLAGADGVELPRRGMVLRAGDVACAISCGDRRVEIRSPIGGTIAAVNDAVASDPSLVTREPYDRGWLFAVAPSGTAVKGLRSGRSAREWLEAEGARLTGLLEHGLAVAAADGGEPIAPAPALLDDQQWAALTRGFLAGGS